MGKFWTRPFASKTEDMDGKNKTIKGVDVNALDAPKANVAIFTVKEWLELCAADTEFYKNVETIASDIQKFLSKDDRMSLASRLNDLDFAIITSQNIRAQNKKGVIKDVDYYAIFPPFKDDERTIILDGKSAPNGYDRKKLLNDVKAKMKKIEEGCRQTKRDLKDKFEVVYKELKKFITNIELRDKIFKDESRTRHPERASGLFDALTTSVTSTCNYWYHHRGIALRSDFYSKSWTRDLPNTTTTE